MNLVFDTVFEKVIFGIHFVFKNAVFIGDFPSNHPKIRSFAVECRFPYGFDIAGLGGFADFWKYNV
jgi:hypothetical protein